MGSAYTTIAADILARYARARGAKAVLVTGTDEHGEKIAAAAAAAGVTPRQHVDTVSASFRALWDQLDVKPDAFVRTTDGKHAALVAEILARVDAAGDIYQADYEGWYCVGCEEYKDEGDLVGDDKRCPLHDAPAVQRSEANWFFRLSKYQADVQALLEHDDSDAASPTFLAPASRRNEVLTWARGGLRDFSISRAAVSWGIPLPRDPDQTVYVWFDALLGYASALLADGETAADLPAKGWPPALHVVGKDILRFHAAYWPGMLLSAGLPLPGRVFAHGFLTKDGRKMGKSLGNVVDPSALAAAYGADAVRFFLARDVPFGGDGDFSEARFVDGVNAALANTLGNLVTRSASLVHKGFGGALPVGAGGVGGDAGDPGSLRAAAARGVADAGAAYDSLRLHDAAAAAVAVAAAGNAALDAAAPWAGLKEGSDPAAVAAAGAALVAALEAARVAAVLLAPVTPAFSNAVMVALGQREGGGEPAWDTAAWGGLAAGTPLPPPRPLLARLEVAGSAPPPPPKVKAPKAKKAKTAAPAGEP